MPFPFLLIGAAVAVGAAGVGAGIKGAIDQNEANKTNEQAQGIVDKATNKVNLARKSTGEAISDLGKAKIRVLDHTVKRFIAAFSQLRNVDFRDSVGLDELNKIHLDKKSFEELRELQGMASSIAGGMASGATLGAITAFGAYGAAMTFGAASTGTAIASLSGVAATNATLAFFGGGSLAAGGLGIAGGTAVLGGIVAAPALAVLGVVMCAKGSANKEKAYANLSQAREFSSEMDVAASMCYGITRRTNLFREALNKMDDILFPLVTNLEKNIYNKGTDFQSYDSAEKRNVAACCALAKSVKALLDTPILTKEGKLTDESERAIENAPKAIESTKEIIGATAS